MNEKKNTQVNTSILSHFLTLLLSDKLIMIYEFVTYLCPWDDYTSMQEGKLSILVCYLGGKSQFFWIFLTFSSFKRQRLSIALFFSSFVLSTSLDSLERTKLNEITEGPKKKTQFQCLASLASLLVNNFCYILQTGRLLLHAALRVVLFIIRKSNNLPLKKKTEQQQKKSGKNKTKQKQREDVYVRQTKKINSTSTKNLAFT